MTAGKRNDVKNKRCCIVCGTWFQRRGKVCSLDCRKEKQRRLNMNYRQRHLTRIRKSYKRRWYANRETNLIKKKARYKAETMLQRKRRRAYAIKWRDDNRERHRANKRVYKRTLKNLLAQCARRKKRYATDPEFREKVRDRQRQWKANIEIQINAVLAGITEIELQQGLIPKQETTNDTH